MDQLAAPQETRARFRPPAQTVGGHARPTAAESPVPSPVPSMDKQLPATVQLPPATAQLLPTGICASTTSTTTTPVRASPAVRASSSPAVPAAACSSPAVPAAVCSSPAVPTAADIPPATSSSIGAHVSSPARPKILLSAPARINLPAKSKNLAYLSRVWGMRWIHDK